MAALGFRYNSSKWLKSYFQNRQQVVQLNYTDDNNTLTNICSEERPVTSGTFQGTILGPDFFDVFLNDLFFNFPDCEDTNRTGYADDLSTAAAGDSFDDLKVFTQKITSELSRWLHDNNLTPNTIKTNYMVINEKNRPRGDFSVSIDSSTINELLFSATIIYIPAIALLQLSGLKIEISIPVLSIICIFYTCIGGLRAIVWADTLQAFFMFIGNFALAILGIYHVGGFKNLWERNENAGRIEFFNLDPDPRTRTTFWTVTVGFFFFLISEQAANQWMVQRCMALPTFRKVKITVWIYAIFASINFVFCGINGLIAFATFYDCDPVTIKTVARADQIMPYLWMFLTREIPAVPGLFVSALFSASFSTMSTTLNCMAGVFVIDIVKPLCKRPIAEAKVTFLMKMMVIIFGGLVLGFAFVIDKMGGLFQIATSFLSLVNGPLFGAFTLGMFCPRVGTKAVLLAILAGLCVITWIFIGAQVAVSRNQIIYPQKDFSIEGCDNNTLEVYYSGLLHVTQNTSTTAQTEPFPLYAVSYYYYTLIGIFTTVVVGLIVSYFTGNNDRRRMNVNLYSPIIRKWIRTECSEAEEMQLNNTD